MVPRSGMANIWQFSKLTCPSLLVFSTIWCHHKTEGKGELRVGPCNVLSNIQNLKPESYLMEHIVWRAAITVTIVEDQWAQATLPISPSQDKLYAHRSEARNSYLYAKPGELVIELVILSCRSTILDCVMILEFVTLETVFFFVSSIPTGFHQ
jgi:hypothetical protein